MAKYPQWEYDLLRYLGTPAPLTNDGMDAQFPNSLLALNLWAQSEGSVTNNALATSGKGKGATTCVAQCGSSSPIYEYDNEADGVAQMGRFLQGSFYTKIVSALVGNADLSTIYGAINSSSWCKGCQNGQYPTALSAAVGGKTPGVSSSVGTGSSAGASGGSGASASTSDLSTCVIQLPGFLFFSGPCFLTKGGVKWLSGAAALVAGVGLAGFGIVLLASSGFGSPDAKQAAGKVAKAAGVSASLFAGQPEAAGAIEARSLAKKAPAVKKAAPARQAPASAASEPRTAGRMESRQIERRYAQAQRDQGPIGPRGGNPTAQRVAARERRGTSVPGARRQPANVPGGRPF